MRDVWLVSSLDSAMGSRRWIILCSAPERAREREKRDRERARQQERKQTQRDRGERNRGQRNREIKEGQRTRDSKRERDSHRECSTSGERKVVTVGSINKVGYESRTLTKLSSFERNFETTFDSFLSMCLFFSTGKSLFL